MKIKTGKKRRNKIKQNEIRVKPAVTHTICKAHSFGFPPSCG